MLHLTHATRRRRIAGSSIAVVLAIGLARCDDGPSSSRPGPGAALASISVAPSNPSLLAGGSQQFSATGTFADGTTRALTQVTWSSSAASVATINATGLARGVAAGTTTITATSAAVSGTTTLTVATLTSRDDWVTYGHDARRTSASQASVRGPLGVAWRYDPESPTRGFRRVYNALATADGALVQWSATFGGAFIGTTAVDRVSTDGAAVWNYDSGTDTNLGNWGSLWGDRFIVNEDGLWYLDANSGQPVVSTSVDWWGETLPDASALYLINVFHVDGPAVFVRSLDASASPRWSQNEYGSCRLDVGDRTGGLALSNGVLFYAAYYEGGTGVQLPFASGVFAFDAESGAQAVYQATQPTSRISADGERVYLIESQNALVARRQSDLSVAWSVPVTGAGAQAPVVANGIVIIGTLAGVRAFNAATGAPAWSSAPLSGTNAPWTSTGFGGGCAGLVRAASAYQSGQAVATTTMAAALSSGTLIVTATDGVHILSLSDGTEVWAGPVAQAVGRVRNPIIVNDPSRGAVVYVVDNRGLIALVSAGQQGQAVTSKE